MEQTELTQSQICEAIEKVIAKTDDIANEEALCNGTVSTKALQRYYVRCGMGANESVTEKELCEWAHNEAFSSLFVNKPPLNRGHSIRFGVPAELKPEITISKKEFAEILAGAAQEIRDHTCKPNDKFYFNVMARMVRDMAKELGLLNQYDQKFREAQRPKAAEVA